MQRATETSSPMPSSPQHLPSTRPHQEKSRLLMSARLFSVISPAKYRRLGSFYFWEVDLWLLKVRFCALSVAFGTLKVIETFPDAIPPIPPREATTKDYRRLWKDVVNVTDEAKAIRILAYILMDEEGRAFTSRLGRMDAEICIEILDHVSRDLHLFPSFAVSDGFFRASQGMRSNPPRSKPSSSH